MIRTTPQPSKQDIYRGWDIICECTTPEDLAYAIEHEPIFENPYFHLAFSHRVLQILAESPDRSLQRCHDDFFLLLHKRIHSRCIQRAASKTLQPPHSQRPVTHHRADLVPSFFIAVLEALDGHIPPIAIRPLEPQANSAQIKSILQTITGKIHPLVPYQPVSGVRWNILVSVCAHCDIQRLCLHPYWIDLQTNRANIALIKHLDSEVLCPRCGFDVGIPAFIWIQERGGPMDIFNAASTVIRATDNHIIYRIAPGPQRDFNNDRVFEQRANRMLKEISPIQPDGSGTLQYVGIAYNAQELQATLDDILSDDTTSCEMNVFIGDVVRKLKTGEYSIAYVDETIRSSAVNLGEDWPIQLHIQTFTSEPLQRLVNALVSEELGVRKHVDIGLRICLADQTARAYLLLEEPALAEIALNRAKRLFDSLPLDPARDLFEFSIQETQAALQVKLGAHLDAAKIRAAQVSRIDPDKPLAERIPFLQSQGSLALNLFRADIIDQAFHTFQSTLPLFQSAIAEAQQASDENASQHLTMLQHSFSGIIANFATMVNDIAHFLEYALIVHALSSEFSSASEALDEGSARALHEHRIELEAELRLTETKAQSFAQTLPMLINYLNSLGHSESALNPSMLRKLAQDLWKQALALSESLKAWAFAARQASHLASSLSQAGEHEEAEIMARKAIDYAHSNRDHTTLIKLNLLLANHRGKQNDGAGAFPYVRAAAREVIHQIAGFGHHNSITHNPHRVAWYALQCARFGANPADAILVAENMKGIGLALSLERPVCSSSSQGTQGSDYLHWCDATGLELDNVSHFLQRLQHPKRTLYIGFLALPGRIWTYALWENGAIVEWVPEPDDIQELLILPLPGAHLSSERQTWSARVSRQLERWAELLLTPLQKPLAMLNPSDRLVISIDQSLAHIPFAGLPVEGDYLCQRAELCFTDGSSMYNAIGASNTLYSSILSIGNPLHKTPHDLPGAEAEAIFVDELCRSHGWNTQLLLRHHATIDAVAEAALDADVLHFSCHGGRIYHSSNDKFPALFLAHNTKNNDRGILDDAKILRRFRLRPGSLVNLMACKSALYDGETGPFVKGLIPAFLVCGAAGVIANLWPIHDEEARYFTKVFYSKLLEGAGPTEALALAQRAFIEGYAHLPSDSIHAWAGYVLYGTL